MISLEQRSKRKGAFFFFVTGMCKSAANGRIRNTVFLNKLNSLVHPKNERFELDRLIDYVYNDWLLNVLKQQRFGGKDF